MPVYDRPPGVLDHLLPVFELGSLPAVSQDDLADRVGGADAVVVANGELQVHLLQERVAQREGILVAGLLNWPMKL